MKTTPLPAHGVTRATCLRRPPHRGIGTLAVTLILLFVTSIGVLYANRSVVFAQRSSVNQAQATLAHEVAEAGLEWAVGMLNSPYEIGSDCTFLTTTNVSFRKRYVLTGYNAAPPTTNVVAATNTFPGCKIDPASGTTTCSCPTAPASGTAVASPSNAAAMLPSFTVAFQNVAGDPEAVQVTAYACTAQRAVCSSTSFGDADGNARLSMTVKLRPLLRAVPPAPLTCGTSCTIGGSFNIANTNVATNGILVNAGTTISTANGTAMTTLQGQPAANALVGNDSSLARLSSGDPTCSNSAMFKTYFGSTLSEYQNAPSTRTLSCGSASDCESKLNNAYADGWRAFYMASDMQLSGNNTYGSVAEPITLVTPNALRINGNNTFYGVIFSNNADWNNNGTGSSTIQGVQITCAAYNANGNGSIIYDADVLKNARRLTGLMVRVPGSWRDFKVDSDTLP